MTGRNLMLSRRAALTAGASVATLAALNLDARAMMPALVAQTTHGPVVGGSVSGAFAFKGIRYGAPPIGPLRFMPPQQPQAWTTPTADAFGPPAMQMPSGTAAATPTTPLAVALQSVFPTLAEVKINNEDCLFLNVWTPRLNDGAKRPVMVWLHGGGFAYGSGAWPSYDGTNLAKKNNVVVVTLNHRLNAFGYLELADIGGLAFAASGNAGMLDIVAALEWVRDNAATFGGDAGNVTIFGESGGGAKVSTLMAMPSAQGLFHKAIVESGPGLKGVPKAAATQDAKDIMAELKVGDVKALQALPADQIVKAALAVSARRGPGAGIRFLAPVVDGAVLPTDPFDPAAPAMSAKVPLIIGTNKDEMTLFMAGQPWFGKMTDDQLNAGAAMTAGDKAPALLAALRKAHPEYSPTYLMTELATTTFMWDGSIKLAERKAAQNAAPVYMYQLRWETPVGAGLFKTPHTLEIPFVFDTVENSRALVGPGPDPQTLADQMSAAWVAFARTGNPDNTAIPHWPPYDANARMTMIFNVKSVAESDPYADVRKALG